LVCEVEEDRGSCWQVAITLGEIDEFFHGELHSFYNKGGAIVYPYGEVVGEEVRSKFRFEGACDVCGNDPSDGSWNTEGA